MKKIMVNKWYFDSDKIVFYLFHISEDKHEYYGRYIDKTVGIWLKAEISRLATKKEIKKTKSDYKELLEKEKKEYDKLKKNKK